MTGIIMRVVSCTCEPPQVTLCDDNGQRITLNVSEGQLDMYISAMRDRRYLNVSLEVTK
jgi:hypothetical protein